VIDGDRDGDESVDPTCVFLLLIGFVLVFSRLSIHL